MIELGSTSGGVVRAIALVWLRLRGSETILRLDLQKNVAIIAGAWWRGDSKGGW